MVRPTARQNLARPDDGLAPASDLKANFLGHLNRIYGKGRELPHRRSEGRLRVHRRVAGTTGGCHEIAIATRRRPARLAARCRSLSRWPARCKPGRAGRPRRRLDPHRPHAAPPDHGVAAAVDHRRPCRPRLARASAPAQKAQVVEFPASATAAADAGNSKLVISVPSGSPNESAAVYARRRHPAADRELRLLREQRRHRALSRTARRRRARSASPTCATWRRRPSADSGPPTWPTTGATCPIRTSAAPSSTISPRRSPIPRTCSDRARWSRPTRSAAPSSSTSIARADRRAPRGRPDETRPGQDHRN